MREGDEREKRIVIGSSQEKVRAACEALLQQAGFDSVWVFADGGELLAEMPVLQPALALLDAKMEGMDGLQVSEMIGERCPCVLLLSPRQLEGMTLDGVSGEERYFVGLHFSKKAIVQTVRFALESRDRLQILRREMQLLRQQQNRRRDVNIAKGILMKELQINEQEAHRILQKSCMETGRTMEEVVQRLIREGTATLEI